MGTHVIVGAGPIGWMTAEELAQRGHDVKVVTRRGSGPTHPAVELVAADATDAARLTRIAAGADALYNCANPPYHRWERDWPPLAASFLQAAEGTGAVLVTMSNLYGYGPVSAPMTEQTPLAATSGKGGVRARMWLDALAAHEAGRIRATEARAADYFGPRVTDAQLGERVVPKLIAGKKVSVVGDPDLPHNPTYAPDAARALAVLGTDERAWGRPWHVPTLPDLTTRDVVDALSAAAGSGRATVGSVSRLALRAAGLFVPALRELPEIMYQFEQPFVVDSSAFSATFGGQPTPLADAAAATVAWYRSRPSARPVDVSATGGRDRR